MNILVKWALYSGRGRHDRFTYPLSLSLPTSFRFGWDRAHDAIHGGQIIEMLKTFPRARYVDPNDPTPGQQKIDRILREHYAESSEKELIKSRIKERGDYTLLGQLTMRLDQSKDHYWADVLALGDSFVRVSPKVRKEYSDILLTSGAWGTMVVEYDPHYKIKERIYPFYIREFHPLQITRCDLDDYIGKRRLFSDDEWINLLVQSIGFNPEKFSAREKWLLLLRLVPFVEPNFNMIELGPRETGKTYTYRNTSSRAFVISGGTATPATLFYHKVLRKVGILGIKDVVYFDEIAHTSFAEADATISVLKDYMQTGRYTRGDSEFTSQASIVLGGNIDTDLEKRCPVEKYTHYFEILPEELQDTAFLDRLHAFLPGWELPKIQPENYAEGYGFISDYLELTLRLSRRSEESDGTEL